MEMSRHEKLICVRNMERETTCVWTPEEKDRKKNKQKKREERRERKRAREYKVKRHLLIRLKFILTCVLL
jgi:hypothetical protein